MFNNSVIWLLLSFFFLLFEMGSPGLLFFLSFCVGAAGTAGAALIITDLGIQIAIFITLSIAAMMLLKRYLPTINRTTVTNGDALKGKTVVVCDWITPERPGAVKIDGALWTAFSGDGGRYAPGNMVTITTLRGAHVVVKISQNQSLR